jgi:hypothetical protein
MSIETLRLIAGYAGTVPHCSVRTLPCLVAKDIHHGLRMVLVAPTSTSEHMDEPLHREGVAHQPVSIYAAKML